MTAGLRPPHPYFNAVLVYPPPAPLECEVDGCHEYPLYECCIQHLLHPNPLARLQKKEGNENERE